MKYFLGSMSGRVFLILLFGILASAMLTWWLVSSERQQAIMQFRNAHAIERAEQLVLALNVIPPAGRSNYLRMARRLGLRVEIMYAESGQGHDQDQTEFSRALQERLGNNYRVNALAAPPSECIMQRRHGLSPLFEQAATCEQIKIALPDASVLRLVILPPRRGPPQTHQELIPTLLLFLCSIGVLAFVVARMTMRPLKQLAQAAFDLGNDINHAPLVLQGTSEIRQAGAAFNAMQARIRQHFAQRTHMLAAITHDLQTPLTRLRLRLEKVADAELRDKLVDDLSAMQGMVREGLDLARSMDSAEAMQLLDLDSLLDSVCSDASDAGQAVHLHGQTGIAVSARPNALRRCLTNLLDNAVKYGHHAQVTAQRRADGGASIRIRDGGDGIADEQLGRVFEPFYRVETSRSRESGGTGLGLTIARNIAEQHGGAISLANHPGGGLEVMLTLPPRHVKPAA
jgi:signal transduction histidine kinase